MLLISSAQQDENSDTDGPGAGGVENREDHIKRCGCKQILIYLAQDMAAGPILSPSAC
jgi:hypothetical protein